MKSKEMPQLKRTNNDPELSSLPQAVPENSSYPEGTGGFKKTKNLVETVPQTTNAAKEIEAQYQQLIQALPAAIYICDANGFIRTYNKAAVELWGREPEIGKDTWCGAQKIYTIDGKSLPMDQCPMAIAIKEGREIQDAEIIFERPDGSKRIIMPHPKPFFNTDGKVTGAVNMLVDITGYKSNEESNGHFAAIIESSDDAIISKTLESIVTSWNSSAERIFGYTAQEMIGISITKIVPPDRLDEEPKILERLKRGERIEHFETKRLTKDGRLLDISLSISPVKNSKGTIIGASKIARDITQQKRAEQQIRESEERLRLAIESADLGSFTWNMLNKEFNFSERLANIYGYSTSTVLSYNDLLAAIDFEDRPIADKSFEKALQTSLLKYEVRIVLPNATNPIRWVRLNAKILFDEKQAPVKMQGIVLDITEQKEAEQRIKDSEERLRLAVTAAEIGLWDLDLTTGLTITSPEHRKIVGHSLVLWSRELFMKSVHPLDRGWVERSFQVGLITGSLAYETRIIREDKSERWIRINGTTVYDKKQNPVRMLGTVLDITDQKKANDDLEKMVLARTSELLTSNSELEKSNHELEQFAYIASHDLQEPLRKIQTFADLVKEHLNDREVIEKYFTKISSSAKRMSTLINDVLNYSRLTKTGEQFQKTDLNQVLNDVLSDYELLIEQKQASVTYNNLPVIKGIPLQLHQLFANLVSNSLKFSENKPIINISSKILPPSEVHNYPKLHEGNEYVQISFSDNGIGFEQQYAEQIFIIFQRLNNMRSYSGTGIGLALCKKIVDHHDGAITTKSAPGMGATFTIILPVNH
ncbi:MULTISPECIES: PAS domain S-box protein [Niastella]|uniref:histidine kinase n=1 Tax=Niastella soli TaxID=2821487 RepID=A0ABS3YSZ1_9BACT|nr:PAS domain S-box protein [Niastella soli]MBO9200964.1 PAS domain S-box protein [Niastella soli]